jgi:hypothetical protein
MCYLSDLKAVSFWQRLTERKSFYLSSQLLNVFGLKRLLKRHHLRIERICIGKIIRKISIISNLRLNSHDSSLLEHLDRMMTISEKKNCNPEGLWLTCICCHLVSDLPTFKKLEMQDQISIVQKLYF